MDSEDELKAPVMLPPLQVHRISSTNRFTSGTVLDLPSMTDNCFVYNFKTPTGKTVFIESNGQFKFSEYNFGTLFSGFNDVTLEMQLDFHYMFDCMLDFKWPNADFEYSVNVYTDRRIAIYDLSNADYWPTILAWFAWQCNSNGINFFQYVRLLNEDDEGCPYGTIFA
ncbi:ORF8 [unidentified adenovirus]|nr:ORF8 [unidentified adenovirus]